MSTHHGLTYKFKTAGPISRLILKACGFQAIVSPWRTIYILAENETDKVLRHHELIHIEQMARDGQALFWLKLVWYLIRYGYKNSPYEVEAYARQWEVEQQPAKQRTEDV